MTNTRDIILKLKEVRDNRGLSYTDILNLMEKNGDFLARSTISRIFSEGSEDLSFRYEETIRPIAKALLDIETIEDNDTDDVQAIKSILKYKIERIEELERQVKELKILLDKEKIKSAEKMEREREQYNNKIDFLKEQVSLKDKRMDLLLDAVKEKDTLHRELIDHIMNCPYRGKCDDDRTKK